MAGDDPPFLPVGTEVSAKYRGAFCEAKVKKIVRSVKCKVYIKETLSSTVVTDDAISKGTLKVGATVEIKNADTGHMTEAVISKLTDCSMYTVVFDDGDEKTLRRTQCCLKGQKHFIESETLDNLPLSHPEHFGTPVMHNKTKRRSGRQSLGNEDYDSDEDSSDESIPKRALYKGRHQELVGKVVLAEFGEKKKQIIPVLVVLPDAHNTELKTKDHILVKSFKDGKFHTFHRKELKEFSKEIIVKIEDKSLKSAIERAVAYFDHQDLPSNWEREELLGSDEEDGSDEGMSSDDEPSEEKDHFVAQLYKFMDDRGTPINKGPTIGNKDLNLYRLFNVVQDIGGYNKVTNSLKWKAVCNKMKIGLPNNSVVSHHMKNAYKKYLHAFEDFYRKLGSSMGTISRPGRSRHSSGRGMMAFNRGQTKETEKEKTDNKEESKSDLDSELEEEDNVKSKSTPKRERITRRDLDSFVKENREKRDGSKDSRKSEKREEDIVKKQFVAKEEVNKKMPKAVKKEEKKDSEDEDVDVNKQDEKQKKVIRRRSMRKEDVKKEENEEKEVEEVTKKSEVKAKLKPPEKKDKKEENDTPKIKKREESKERKTDKKEEKKEERKEKVKTAKKDVKKEPEDETKETDKTEKKIAKKEVVKKGKIDEELDVKKKVKEEQEIMVEEEEIKIVENKAIHKEHPVGTKLQVRYGKGRTEKVYDAKIVEIQKSNGLLQYLVHYAGWNNRYDEWIRPDQVVNVVSKPSDTAAIKKKVKESPPKCLKGQMIKKTKNPIISQTPPSSALNRAQDSRPMKKSPAHTPTVASVKQSKQRPTRSNSVDLKGIDGLQAKPRRTRKNSGVTESSDIISQGSVSDDNNEYEDNLETDESELQENVSSPKEEETEKQEELNLSIENTVDKCEDVDWIVENITDKKSDILAVEQDLLNKAAEIEKVNELDLEKEEKQKDALKLEQSKISGKGNEKLKEKIDGSKNQQISSHGSKDQQISSPPEIDFNSDKIEKIITKDVDMPNIVPCEEIFQASRSSEEETQEEKLQLDVNEDFNSEGSISMEKLTKISSPDRSLVVDDRFEFKEDEDDSLPELTIEKETIEKFEKPNENEIKEKVESDCEKKQRGRKKDPNKVTERKEPTKEKKRGRPSLASLAERRAAVGQNSTKPQEEIELEPPSKKTRESKLNDKLSSENSSYLGEIEKPSKQNLGTMDKNDEEIQKEENEVEKKRVKKKVKKKSDIGDISFEQERKEKKEVVKTSAKTKVDKNCKSKVKKLKDCEDENFDSDCLNECETHTNGENDTCLSESCPNKSLSVISLDSSVSGAGPHNSATESLQKSAEMNDASIQLKTDEQIDSKSSTNLLQNSSALFENTPPTTPEHEMDIPSSSQEHSHDSASSDKIPDLRVNEHHYGNESPAGNASPSSNDGSVGSGNVACSESSNNEAPLNTSLSKRRRESDDITPTKRKRRGKQKTERKNSKHAGSDSDEVGPERPFSPEPGLASPTKISTPIRSQSQRPKYHLNLEEGQYLEGERRISFIMEKIQEIRKIYMNLKSEVACIDRRRKRARRRERESAQNSSSGTPEGETAR